jgi:hypothetical protein
LSDNEPWRYKGVTAFKLCRLFTDGVDIEGFLSDYSGYNTLRVWDYTPVNDWHEAAWDSCTPEQWINFIKHVGKQGWRVEVTLLTDDNLARIQPAKSLVSALKAEGLTNVLLEAGNEPTTHKNIDTAALRTTIEQSGMQYCSGDYEDSDRWYGSYYVNHTARTPDWVRRAHDLQEFYTGAGPDKPHPARHVPCLADEPGKLQDVGAKYSEWRGYYGACSLMGGGALFHSETGKHGQRPTITERELSSIALNAMNVFPADAPRGAYRRIVEPGNEPGGPTERSRTYVVGNYMVRCQQFGNIAPEPNWQPLDSEGILWQR